MDMNLKIFTTAILTLFFAANISAQLSFDEIIADYEHVKKVESQFRKSNWSDNSSGKIIQKTDQLKKWITALNTLNQKAFTETELINFEMLKLILEDDLYHLTSEAYLIPLNSEGGFITSMMYSTSGLKLKSKEDENNYILKLSRVGNYLQQQKDLLRIGRKKGIDLPKIVIENCIVVLEDLLKVDDEDFFILKPFQDKASKSKIDVSKIKNEFVDFNDFLKNDYLKTARGEIGISENSNGKAYYEQRVRYYTTLDMTPQEVFDLGHKEVKRIKNEMESIIADLKFDGSFSDFLKFLREDPQFYAKSPEELLKHAAWLSKKAEEILPSYFGLLPRLPFTVNPVPAAIAPNYTTGRYSGGSMERKQAGQYWVNTYNLPARPMYVLPSLTLHEAVPGHHLQISLAKELLSDDLPGFRSQYLSAYGEGWGLYSEFLGKEAGMYTTPYEDFGRLTYEMWRACRLVVDPGMHYFNWTRDEAVQFMKENTSLSIHEINTEINRYIGWPGQAVSYKIGELKIRELRKQAENELKDKFDIRSFHDLVLANGSIPLKTLERIVIKYIEETKTDE